jgi:hypothetical protein
MVCSTCGAHLDENRKCHRCRGQTCSVCGKPIYRDESYASTARGRRHVRCVDGTAFPRPKWMVEPQLIVPIESE